MAQLTRVEKSALDHRSMQEAMTAWLRAAGPRKEPSSLRQLSSRAGESRHQKASSSAADHFGRCARSAD